MIMHCLFHTKLMDPRVCKMANIVETVGSMYWPALSKIYTDVKEGRILFYFMDIQCFTICQYVFLTFIINSLFTGLKEAHDIVMYLKPLQKTLDEIEQLDYPLVNLLNITQKQCSDIVIIVDKLILSLSCFLLFFLKITATHLH